MADPEIAPGTHLQAGEALYRVEAVEGDRATVVVLAGSQALIGRSLPWPLSNIAANLKYGHLAIVPAPAPKQRRRRDTLL